MSVCIDVGHGGSDSGAIKGNHVEKVYNLDTALACKKELEKYGEKVVITRSGDKYLSLSERCSIANKNKCNLFISIHHNSGGGDRGEVIYSIKEGKGKTLAHNIAKEMKDMGQTTVQEYSRKSEKTGKDYYAVIRGTNMSAVIVEVCFLDNSKDVQIADTLAERQRNGREIAHGILRYLGKNVDEKKSADELIVYGNEVDKIAAEILHWKKPKSLLVNVDTARSYNAKKIIAVGGIAAKAFPAAKKIVGNDRYETVKKVSEYIDTL